jgi:tRNA A37 methylthiotransferase MiaB
MKNCYIIANGCPENRLDAARIERFLAVNGWKIVDNINNADLVLFNACGLKDESQTDSSNIIRHIYRSKTDAARVIVSGCLPKINPMLLKTLHDGISFGQDDEAEVLNNIIDARVPLKKVYVNKPIQCTTSADIAIRDWAGSKDHLLLLKVLVSLSHAVIPRIANDPQLLKQFLVGRLCNREVNLYSNESFYIKISTGCVNQCTYCGVKFSRGHVRSKSIDQVREEFMKGIENGYRDMILIGTEISSYGRDIGTDLYSLLKVLTNIQGDYTIKLRNVHPRTLIDNAQAFIYSPISGTKAAEMAGQIPIAEKRKRFYRVCRG